MYDPELPLPTQMICHNHWTVNGAKISKSKGNYIPLDALRKYLPGELIRFFLLTHDTLMRDGNFSTQLVAQSVNQLADVYGNLVMRSLGKNIAGPLLQQEDIPAIIKEETKQRLQALTKGVSECYDRFAFCDGYDLILSELKSVACFILFRVDESIFRQSSSLDNCERTPQ